MPNRLAFERSDRLPVQAFFNAIPDDLFWQVVQSLLQGVGYSINDCHCEFPGDLDFCEDTFEGVRFSLYEDAVILDETELRRTLRVVCEEHVRRHPDNGHLLEELLGK